MRLPALLLATLLLGACAHQAPAPPLPSALLHDQWFAAPSEPPDAAAVLELSDAMRSYLATEVARRVVRQGTQRALSSALYERGQLRLEYDTAVTRTAAQAFDARAGNCLSLVIMTMAFAKALNLEVQVQRALVSDTWLLQRDLLLYSGHVNITLGARLVDRVHGVLSQTLTIDFLPPEDVAGLRTQTVGEATVLAMFMANRAAELLTDDRVDDAYWHARESLRLDPSFSAALNTLGVVYLRRGRAVEAEQALRHVLEHEPRHARALSNLALALDAQGRNAEAGATRDALARIEPEAPYRFYALGLAAAQRGDWAAALELFGREAERADAEPEVHHRVALAAAQVGDVDAVRRALARAMAQSSQDSERRRYAAKLARLAAPAVH